jgi:signal transduction histidine kinase
LSWEAQELPERLAERDRRLAEFEQRAHALEREVESGRRLEAERVRLYEAERLARAEIALLYRLTNAVNRADTLDEVYDAALDGIATALGVSRASILLFDADGVIRFKAWRGLSDAYRAAVEGHSPWRPEDRDVAPVLSENVREDPHLAALLPVFEREEIGALGFFPLLAGGRLVGKFMVYHSGAHAFTDEEVRLASAIADQIAFAVDRKLAALERERFLGIVGHDLKNPLGAIKLTAAALQKRVSDPALSSGLRRIGSSADRMERLIRQLLELARARSGSGIPVVRRPSDLARVARQVIEEIEAAHPGGSIALAVEGDVSGDWDPDRVAEVLSNLVGNAVQHGEGAVDVRLSGEGDDVVAAVHNGGRAIPTAILPSLFDPFRRGDDRGPSRSPGVGLGLFISREIVRAHGGGIEVRSSDADGTTLTVRLPRAAARGA